MKRLVRSASVHLGMFVAGLTLTAAFPPWDCWWLAPLAVCAFTLVVRVWPRPGRVAFSFGIGFLGGLLHWLTVLGPDAWLGLTVLWSLWFALLGLLVNWLAELRWWPVWTALAWVAVEAGRGSFPWGGFPWGRLAFSQSDAPAIGLAALGGTPLMTFAVALAGTLLAWSLLALKAHRRGPGTLAAGAALAAFCAGIAVPIGGDGQSAGGPPHATAAVVQGNVPRSGMDFNAQRRAVLDNHVKETMALATRVAAGEVAQPEFVIWPENASDIDPYTNADAATSITAAARAIGVPILVGAVIDNPDDPKTVLNVGIVWDPVTGPGERYAKQHPVPFGEYLPMRGLLTRLITRFDRIPKDFARGQESGVLDIGPARIGDLICFEVAYDDIPRRAVADGGRVLVVQTNNATYGRTAQPHQQLAMARIRAVEHGRSVLVAATSGISAVIAPDGSVIEQPEEFVPASLVHSVPLRDGRTIADRAGPWPERGVVVIVGLGVVGALIRRRKALRWPKQNAVESVEETA